MFKSLSNSDDDPDFIAIRMMFDYHRRVPWMKRPSMFLTNIGFDDIEESTAMLHILRRIATCTQQDKAVQHVISCWKAAHGHSPNEYERYNDWDEMTMLSPMGGFGTRYPQLYCKVVNALTKLHNELGGSSAMSYIMFYSTAVVLWIGGKSG